MHECFDFSTVRLSAFKDKKSFFEEARKRILVCQTEPVSAGYGFEYTPEVVSSLLDVPLPAQTTFLNKKGLDYFGSSLRRDRMRVDAAESRQWAKPDGWYMQGAEPTCYPWALANGIRALQGTNDPVLLSRLLNYANNYDGQGETGLSNEQLLTEAHKHDSVAVLDLSIAVVNRPNYTDFAKAIMDSINDRQFLLQGVDGGFYKPLGSHNFSHSLAIVGYEVSATKWLDLQVIDSNYGIMPIPAEHIYYARLREEAVAARIA